MIIWVHDSAQTEHLREICQSLGIGVRLVPFLPGNAADWTPLGLVVEEAYQGPLRPIRHRLAQGPWRAGNLLWPSYLHPILAYHGPESEPAGRELEACLGRRGDKCYTETISLPSWWLERQGRLRELMGTIRGTLLLDERVFQPGMFQWDCYCVPETECPYATQIVAYKKDILVDSRAPRTADILYDNQFNVHRIEGLQDGLKEVTLILVP